ncbi:hypothetical protein [Desulfococcus sp.]|uniref:hypothetical protein n=1 Tax=Desulfococcus sp. TaxID=2025834 RepID=UPI003593A759
MKEFEAFAKALSLGMKALAKIIETAADQLEEHVQSAPGKEAAREAEQPSRKKEKAEKRNQSEKTTKRKTASGSAPKAEVKTAPEAGNPEPETPQSPGRTTQTPDRPKSRKEKPVTKPSDTEAVYQHIQAAKDTIHLDDLHRLTGFEKKKLHNIIHRLKKNGRIKVVGKAVYTSA